MRSVIRANLSLVFALLAACGKEPVMEGHFLPNTSDYFCGDLNPDDCLLPSPDGKKLIYFNRDKQTVLLDLESHTKRISNRPPLGEADFFAWSANFRQLMVARKQSLLENQTTSDDFIQEGPETSVEMVAPFAFRRHNSIFWDPEKFRDWLIEAKIKMPDQVSRYDLDLGAAASFFIQDPRLRSVFLHPDPRPTEVSPTGKTNPFLLCGTPDSSPWDEIKRNQDLLWVMFPRDIASTLLVLRESGAFRFLEKVRTLRNVSVLKENDYCLSRSQPPVAIYKGLSVDGKTMDIYLEAGAFPSMAIGHHRLERKNRSQEIGHFWLSPDSKKLCYTVEGDRGITKGLQKYRDLYFVDLELPPAVRKPLPIGRGTISAVGWGETSREFSYAVDGEGIWKMDVDQLRTQQIRMAEKNQSAKRGSTPEVIMGQITSVYQTPQSITLSFINDDRSSSMVEIPADQAKALMAQLDQLGGPDKVYNRRIKITNPRRVEPVKLTVGGGMSEETKKKAREFNVSGLRKIIPGPDTQVSIE